MDRITPNKALGQNFFTNQSLAKVIVRYVVESTPTTIVEIGPGPGTFTNLLSKEANVLAIEKDRQFELLLSQIPKVEVVYEDILKADLESIFAERGIDPTATTLFGSLPYNISKRIITKLLRFGQLKQLFFIIQKEVAEKYCAVAPDNNILSLTSDLYCTKQKLFDINPGSFNPPPKVTSSFVSFTLHESIRPDAEEISQFITKAFSHPRKLLSNNLKQLPDDIKQKYISLLSNRPSQITAKQYIELFEQLKS